MKPVFKLLLLLTATLLLSISAFAQVNDLAATWDPVSAYLCYGELYHFTVTVSNPGTNPQSVYSVRLYKEGGIELTAIAGQTINPGATLQTDIPWIPDFWGNSYIYAKVVLPGDQNPTNDQTQNKEVYISDAGIIITVGDGSQLSNLPLNLHTRNTLCETIYYMSEINFGGILTELWLHSNFADSVSDIPVNVWLGTTTATDLSAGWIPSGSLTQVFSGVLDFPAGPSIIEITFQTPFVYGQDNLVVLMERVMTDAPFGAGCLFYSQTLGTNRTRWYSNDFIDLNPADPPVAVSTLTGQFPKLSFITPNPGIPHLAGFVYTGDYLPLVGAAVHITNGITATTNAIGYYQNYFFDNPPYQVTASMPGYYDQTATVTMPGNGVNAVLNFHLQPISLITVTGTVAGSDNPTIGLSGAMVTLTGFANYTATTNAQGQFTIPGVYTNQTYQYEVTADGYQPATGTIIVGETNYNMGTIMVSGIVHPPQAVSASLQDNYTEVLINWQMPLPSPFSIVTGYKVWRLVQGQEQNEPSWTLLTTGLLDSLSFVDIYYPNLPANSYRWAVKAVYTGNVHSDAAFSNPVEDEGYGYLAGVVRYWPTNTLLAGAVITAGNTTAISSASGNYIMGLIPGTYAATCHYPGYQTMTTENIIVAQHQFTMCNFLFGGDANEDEIQTLTTALGANYPNPFRSETTLSYDLKEPAKVCLGIYNLKGQLIRTLVQETKAAGKYTAIWDGKDNQGKAVSSGVYHCHMQAGSYCASRRLLLIK
jgi:hypothetical protein